ncbi:MAG: hypothetical protein ABI910_16725 [Gemmatimonadota bacterium]
MMMMPTSRALLRALSALAVLAATPLGAQQLGPVDGAGLAAADTGRVHAGMLAPDFTLEAFAGSNVTLSQFRGKKTVLLAFYRGHW